MLTSSVSGTSRPPINPKKWAMGVIVIFVVTDLLAFGVNHI
jgi:hypothetical protein